MFLTIMSKSKDSPTDLENPKQPKHQRLPTFRSAHPHKDPTREPETSKSWVMTLKQEGDNWLSANAQQRVQLHESMSATLEPPVGNEDSDAPSHSAQSDSVPRPKKKKKTTCVHVTFACLCCLVILQISLS